MFIFESLWFFLPALVANQCPGLGAYFNFPWHKPVSKKWLGANKTWDSYYVAATGSIIMIYWQRPFERVNETIGLFDYNRGDLWFIGLLFGIGAVLGDHVKSFLKRRIGIQPGERWWPFDAIDFIVGSMLTTLPVTGWIGFRRTLAIVLVWPIVHYMGNQAGYRLGLRKVPW